MQSANPSIFISYRRSDTSFQSSWIRERLSLSFGERNVFFDIDSVALGADVHGSIQKYISRTDVLLVIIGESWQPERLLIEDDFVRLEILEAFRQEVSVVPVLVGDAPMPIRKDLPIALEGLTQFNGARIRPAPDFDNDVARLVEGIRLIVEKRLDPRLLDTQTIDADLRMHLKAEEGQSPLSGGVQGPGVSPRGGSWTTKRVILWGVITLVLLYVVLTIVALAS